jgi:glutamyl-tRNA reductase
MSEQDRELVETVSKGIINTLLHDPTVRVQDAVREAHGQQHVESLRYLFDLDDER